MNMNTQNPAIVEMRRKAWAELRRRVENCQKCTLCKTRKQIVLGEGTTENCRCVIIGEAPGETEDEQGRPFVGDSGKLLRKILNDCRIPREKVYITNVLKCRPPHNRDPETPEMDACEEHLEAQLLLLQPDIVVTVGRISTQWLLKSTQTISNIRGKWLDWRMIKLLPIFHPSYLLRSRNVAHLQLTYKDIYELKQALDRLQ